MDKEILCEVCGTPLVKSSEELKFDGSLTFDGSWNMDNMICPKCHPELVKTK